MFRFNTAIFAAAGAASLLSEASACFCAAPDNCYHAQWAVPCSDANDQAACVASNGEWCGDSPSPPPSPPPPRPSPRPTPTPTPPTPTPSPPSPPPAPAPASGILGYWDKTWKAGDAPSGANLGVAFNGWANASHALLDSENVYNCLTGTKYVSIGGGNANGRFSRVYLEDLEEQIHANKFLKWEGIALDVEECSEAGLASAFKSVLAAAKSKGFQTMVTISHNAPYGCSDANALMQAFLADSNTDYLSPQLYGGGAETSPDFSETSGAGVHWGQYVGMRPMLIPSIVDETHYSRTVDFFTSTGVPVAGYVQWASVNVNPCPAPAPPPTTTAAPSPTPPAPSPTPPAPSPSGDSFTCVSGQCVAGEGGVSMDICSAVCTGPPGDSFRCVDGQCVAGEGGVSKDICSAVCTPSKYKCVDNQCQPDSAGYPHDTCAAICVGSAFV